SNYPFKTRKDGGPRDDFEKEALRRLGENPKQVVYSFEDYEGKPVLRYATARVMRESCIGCHNMEPDSPKKDWKGGDVRGALEIIRPLDKDMDRAHRGLRTTFILVGAISAALLALSTILLVLSNRRTRRGPGRRASTSGV